MAEDYKVVQVSQQEPKKYEGQYGTTYYIKVKLEGHEKPVEIGKKDPHALKAGDTVYGHIEETDFPTDKFKAEQKQQNFYSKAGKSFDNPDKQAEIKAEWAINQSREYMQHMLGEDAKLTEILDTAKVFYTMVDQVKGSDLKADGVKGTQTGYDAFKAQGQSLKAKDDVAPMPNDDDFAQAMHDGLEADGIDMSEIPF